MLLAIMLGVLILYYILIIPLVRFIMKNSDVSLRVQKKVIIIFLLLPLVDHVVGYIYFKAFSLTKNEAQIYKQVSDNQERKNFWLNEYFINSSFQAYSPYLKLKKEISTPIKGLNTKIYLTENLELKKIYVNKCKIGYEYNCNKIKQVSDAENIKVYDYPLDDINILNEIRKSSRLVPTRIIKKDKLEIAYLNNCLEMYDDTSSNHKAHKLSCTYSDTLIKKYRLNNVISRPKTIYKYIDKVSRDNKESVFPYVLGIYKKRIYMENEETKELMYEYYHYYFYGGWFWRFFTSQPVAFFRDTMPEKYFENIKSKVNEIRVILNSYVFKLDKLE